MEDVFDASRILGEAVTRHDQEGNSFIEGLTEAQFGALCAELPGMILSRHEVVLAEPDPAFLKKLVARHGRRVDREFLRNYAATRPDGVWPSYVQQQTDVTGCTDFGSGELAMRYAGWRQFRDDHPNAYEAEVQREIQEIEEDVDSTCACGSKETVLREMEILAKRFPQSPAGNKARQRLREIQQAAPGMRYNCLSG